MKSQKILIYFLSISHIPNIFNVLFRKKMKYEKCPFFHLSPCPSKCLWTSLVISAVTPATMCCSSATLYEPAALWSSGTDISHTLSSFIFNIIGLVQRIIRFVMRTEPKASYRTVQYKYAYCYTNNIYIYTHKYSRKPIIWSPADFTTNK